MRAFFFLLIAALLGVFFWQRSRRIDYEPLADKYEWTMNAAFVSTNGKTASSTMHRKIEGKVLQGGKTYYRCHNWSEGGPTKIDFIALTRKDDSGVYTIPDGDVDAKEQMTMKLPIIAGQTWEILRKGESINFTVIGIETVTVDDKVYENCFHVRSDSKRHNSSEDDWEAPNIGTVKSHVIFPSGTTLTLTLTDFNPGK